VTDAAVLDRLAARALPAAVEERIGGWLARASPGEDRRRVNSALPVDGPLDVDAIERWYRARGRPPLVMVSPCERHAALDEELARRGWTLEAPSDVLVGDPDTVLDALDGPPHPVVPGELVGPDGMAADGLGAAVRSPDPVVPLVAAGGAGRATVVLHERWSIILALEVDPGRRRQGIAAALLRAWARAAEGRRLYLQVHRDNGPALALYRAAGFTRSHGYHYRRAPRRPSPRRRAGRAGTR
jgi:ribosomal protein S18 acetylase RimI-like enzyme